MSKKSTRTADLTPEQITEAFTSLKKEEDWGCLGNMFFELFAILPKGNPTRTKASELWATLSKEEQENCEGA